MVIIIAFATLISTLIGGLFALHFKDKLHLVLGFSAGAVISVAFFSLLPEAIELGSGFYLPVTIIQFTAIGFLCYLVLDRVFFFHAQNKLVDELHEHDSHRHISAIGAGSIAVHSFLDGMAIGLGFQVSLETGIVLATAVLVHKFSDGVNVVGLILRSKKDMRSAMKWLMLVACTPILGAFSTLFFVLPEHILAVILSLFAGFFFYISATDLIPESHHAHPKVITTIMTIIGVLVLYIAIQLTGG